MSSPTIIYNPFTQNFDFVGTGGGSSGITTLDGDSGSATGTTVTVSGGSTGLTTSASGSTVDMTGTLNVSHGGTGDTSFTAYAVIAGGITSTGALQSVASVGTSGQVLTSNGAAALPTFQSLPSGSITLDGDSGSATGTTITISGGSTGLTTSASSATMNLTGTLNVTHGGTGAASFTSNSLLLGDGTSAISALGAATNGQIPIGSTSNSPVLATITAGTGITVTNGAGSITISTTGLSGWSDQSGAFNAVAEHGYFISGTSTATLPASPSEGTTISFIVDTTQILTIQANTGQSIRIGSAISAAAGTAVNNAQGDSIELVYRTSGTTWFSLAGPQGTWTIN